MGTKVQNALWMRRVDKWEEVALVAGIRSARAYVAGPNEDYHFVESYYFNRWSDRIIGVLPIEKPTSMYIAGYNDADAYFQNNPPPQPVAAKPVMRTHFG